MVFVVRRGHTADCTPPGKGGEEYDTAVEANPGRYNFQVGVTDGHEAEAKAAQMKKEPNRIGRLLLAMLGYRPRQRD